VRLLVTGGSGFLDGYVLGQAAERGHEIVALARNGVSAATVAARGSQPLAGDLSEREQAIRQSALKCTILRPTMIYGAAGDRSLSRLLVLLSRTPLLPVLGGGSRLQQPVHVADVAGADGGDTTFRPVPLRPVLAAARVGERLSRQPRIRAEQLQRLAEGSRTEAAAMGLTR
jgi:uncharacterized protein YbjT (DUF2867 family)